MKHTYISIAAISLLLLSFAPPAPPAPSAQESLKASKNAIDADIDAIELAQAIVRIEKEENEIRLNGFRSLLKSLSKQGQVTIQSLAEKQAVNVNYAKFDYLAFAVVALPSPMS